MQCSPTECRAQSARTATSASAAETAELENLAQQSARGLRVHDGWRYFVHGWSQVIADVFDVPMPPQLVDELAALAEVVR